jgi:hypothetical protein
MSTFGSAASLSVLDQRLEAHFVALRRERNDKASSELPVFALEHGLSELELSLLSTAVRGAVPRHHLPTIASLPFVIYAAEIGYDYSGDEYWQTFGERTPGWSEIEDRDFIRQSFKRFASRFRGAIPVGPWAQQFSIICWPITHAVLPTDLQQQLVRLIFEYRTGLSGDLMADPLALGKRLAARTSLYSSRFRYFAQNNALLGQVAAALLSPENEPSPYLLDSTLQRIVRSLSTHHQVREWLRDAKTTANRVRTRGFRRLSPSNASTTAEKSIKRLPRAADPGVLVQLSDQDGSPISSYPICQCSPSSYPIFVNNSATLVSGWWAEQARSRGVVSQPATSGFPSKCGLTMGRRCCSWRGTRSDRQTDYSPISAY